MGKLIIGDNMKKKKKINKNKNIFNNKYTYITIFLILILLSYLTVANMVNIEKYFRDILFYPTKLLDNHIFIEEVNNELQSENEDLKKLLEIKESLIDYDVVYATVIQRNNSYWFNTITINKGKSDGIEENMAVVDSNGLIGSIDKVSNNTSVIKLITMDDKYNNISVKIKGEEEINKILKVSNNKLIIEGINKNAKVSIGNKIVTNGLSDKFPSGIIIGEIISLDNDFYNVSNIATVKLAADMENIRFVAILKRKI